MKQVTRRQIKQIILKIEPDTTLEQMKDFTRKIPGRGLMIVNGILYCEQSDESRDEWDTWEMTHCGEGIQLNKELYLSARATSQSSNELPDEETFHYDGTNDFRSLCKWVAQKSDLEMSHDYDSILTKGKNGAFNSEVPILEGSRFTWSPTRPNRIAPR